MSSQTDKALSEIAAILFDSGIVQQNIKDGSLDFIRLSIEGDESLWSLAIFVHIAGRSFSDFIDDEEDDIICGVIEYIEKNIESYFEAIGFFGNERDNIAVICVVQSPS